MTDLAVCAHLRVSWHTEALSDGQTRGWWECDTCAAGFTPSGVHSAELAKLGTALDIARQDAETFRSLYGEAKVTEARLMEIPGRPVGATPCDVVTRLRARAEGAEALAARLVGLLGAARADLETMLTVAHTVTWAEGMEGRAYDEARTRRLVMEIGTALVTIGRGAE